MNTANPRPTTTPEYPKVSPIRRFGAVVFGDFAGISLVVIGVLMFVADMSPLVMLTFAILAAALIRIIGETLWGTSPGKHLSGMKVVYCDRSGHVRTGAQRLLPAVTRNAWLWIPVLLALIMPANILSGIGVTALVALILRKDGRPLTDRLAGAWVTDIPKAPQGAR